MFWSIFASGVMAFVTLITLLVSSLHACIMKPTARTADHHLQICMPSVEVILSYYSPIVGIIYECTGRSLPGTTTLIAGITIMFLAASMAVFSSVSRLTWAWARDGGLPPYFGYVDGNHRIPFRAVLLTFVIVLALSLL